MKVLIREIEERYGNARSILMPVVVTRNQLEMLQLAQPEAEQGWNFMVLLFAGAKLVTELCGEQVYRLIELRLPSDIVDLEDFEEAFKAKIESEFNLKIELSRYLLLAHCTFMATGENTADEDGGTSSRTIHVFTARVVASDESANLEKTSGKIKLVKPTALLDSLQAEWGDTKTQLASGGSFGDMRAEYDKSWSFVRLRVVGTAFQALFDWPLPEM